MTAIFERDAGHPSLPWQFALSERPFASILPSSAGTSVRFLTFSLLVSALLVAPSVTAMSLLERETVGEKLRRSIAVVDKRCREQKLGPYLDPTDPEYRQKSRLRSCEILKVQPFNVETIQATPEGKFAYSIQLPTPLDKPQVLFKRGMSAAQYFQALCQKEAGDFVFETAANVNRILQVRRSPTGSRPSLGPYSEELPLGPFLGISLHPEWNLVAPVTRRYSLLEVPASDASATYRLYFRDPGDPIYGVGSRPLPEPSSRYGYVWRGVEREAARELGILGGELIVLDLQRRFVMAVRRDFALYTVIEERFSDAVMFSTKRCGEFTDGGARFLARVLIPTAQ
jgi:hypothetical protein